MARYGYKVTSPAVWRKKTALTQARRLDRMSDTNHAMPSRFCPDSLQSSSSASAQTFLFLSMTVGFSESHPTLYVVHRRAKLVLCGPNSIPVQSFRNYILSCFRKRIPASAWCFPSLFAVTTVISSTASEAFSVLEYSLAMICLH